MDHKFPKPVTLPADPITIAGYTARGTISPSEVTYDVQHLDANGGHVRVPRVTPSTVRQRHVVGHPAPPPPTKPIDQAAIDAAKIGAEYIGESITSIYARQAAYYQAHAFKLPAGST